MLQVNRLKKSYGPRTLFEDVSFVLGRGERAGLVGRNGHGKSTFFRILTGEEDADDGTITFPKGYRVGHLTQHFRYSAPTVLEEACLGLPPDERDQTYRAERILSGLGFTDEWMARPPAEFSGGYQLRLNLVKLLLSEPELLLLDEPTNYLDIVAVRWLARELSSWKREMLLVSHDRTFMDGVTTHTIAIHRGRFRKVEGGTAKSKGLLASEDDVYERTRRNEEKKRAEAEAFIDRFKAQASKASLVQSRVKALERMPTREELAREAELDFRFTERPFQAKVLAECSGVAFAYPGGAELFSDVSLRLVPGARLGVVGPNGRGKSTLLKILAGELTPTRGETGRHERTTVGYFGQTNVARLDPQKTVEDEVWSADPLLHRTRVRGLCGAMLFDGDKAERKVATLSGGERSRVLLAKILATPTNVLLLDEPTSHLDAESIEALVRSIRSFSGAVVIVTHDEGVLRDVARELVVFQAAGASVYPGTYDEFLQDRGWDEEADDPPKAKKATARRPAGAARERLEARFAELDRAIAEARGEAERLTGESRYDEAARAAEKADALAAEQLDLLERLES